MKEMEIELPTKNFGAKFSLTHQLKQNPIFFTDNFDSKWYVKENLAFLNCAIVELRIEVMID